VLGASSSETSLASWLEENLSRLERVVADGAYLEAIVVLSVVTSHYNGINLLIVS
jgi:hypothetical protein